MARRVRQHRAADVGDCPAELLDDVFERVFDVVFRRHGRPPGPLVWAWPGGGSPGPWQATTRRNRGQLSTVVARRRRLAARSWVRLDWRAECLSGAALRRTSRASAYDLSGP